MVVCVERYQGSYTIVSDCLGVVLGAQRLLEVGTLSPTSRHADLWARLHRANRRVGAGVAQARWVPSHDQQSSDRISEDDRRVNQEVGALANAGARRVELNHTNRSGTTPGSPSSGQCRRQSTILDAARRGGSAAPGGEHNRRRLALVRNFHTRKKVRGALSGICRESRCALGARTWRLLRTLEVQVHPLFKAGDFAAGQESHGQAFAQGETRNQAVHDGGWLKEDGTRLSLLAGTGREGTEVITTYVLCPHSKEDGRYICLDCGRHCIKWRELVGKPCPRVPQKPKYVHAFQVHEAAGVGPQSHPQGCQVPVGGHSRGGGAPYGWLQRSGVQ